MRRGSHRQELGAQRLTLGVHGILIGVREAVGVQQVACSQPGALPSCRGKPGGVPHIRAQRPQALQAAI